MHVPKDILELIFLRLSLKDIATARVVCKAWKDALCSQDFLSQHGKLSGEKWVAVFDENGLKKQRVLILYNSTSHAWHQVSLDFLPSQFPDPVAAAGGLLCVSGQAGGKNAFCVCNPFTREYKIYTDVDQEQSVPVAVMVESKHEGEEDQQGSRYQVAVLHGDALILHSSARCTWRKFDTGLPYRPRSPVACGGVIYGLQNMGSPWKSSWRLVYAKVDELHRCREVWCPLNRPEWGEILDILMQPRLLESKGCLLLTGGLRRSSASNLCSTFIILKLDLISLEWSEAGRMPNGFYKHFDGGADLKIFGGRDVVYFSSKAITRLVVCDFSKGEGSWRWVDDCPVYNDERTFFCKGFPFEPCLDSCP